MKDAKIHTFSLDNENFEKNIVKLFNFCHIHAYNKKKNEVLTPFMIYVIFLHCGQVPRLQLFLVSRKY
jgi:hypothetical protein